MNPSNLQPIYITDKPNSPIKLYEGSLEIHQNGTIKQGEGKVYFEWLPYPSVKFELLYSDRWSPLLNSAQRYPLNLLGISTKAEASVHTFREDGKGMREVSGKLSNPIVDCSDKRLSYIVFHLVNIFWSSRVNLEVEGWSVTIDPVENHTDIKKALKSEGGYAITHIGKIERLDNKEFKVNESDEFLEDLQLFFSFSIGFYTAAILQVGYNRNGDKIWEKWNAERYIKSWENVYSCLTSSKPESLAQLFPGFWRQRQNTIWKEAIGFAIHWYMESMNGSGAMEGYIVLEQIAFELLSTVLIVEDKKIISSDGFKNLPAADQLRLLLSYCSIPLTIPNSLTHLDQAVRDSKQNLNWEDSPQSLTEIRNSIVHSGKPAKRKRIFNLPLEVKAEIYQLGLWYLELVLLYIFGYQGDYFNRIAGKKLYPGCIESVPWAKN